MQGGGLDDLAGASGARRTELGVGPAPAWYEVALDGEPRPPTEDAFDATGPLQSAARSLVASGVAGELKLERTVDIERFSDGFQYEVAFACASASKPFSADGGGRRAQSSAIIPTSRLSSRPSEARAGTHNHRRLLLQWAGAPARATALPCGYGSPRSRGRH